MSHQLANRAHIPNPYVQEAVPAENRLKTLNPDEGDVTEPLPQDFVRHGAPRRRILKRSRRFDNARPRFEMAVRHGHDLRRRWTESGRTEKIQRTLLHEPNWLRIIVMKITMMMMMTILEPNMDRL